MRLPIRACKSTIDVALHRLIVWQGMLWGIILCLTFIGPADVVAQANTSTGMLFLHLRISDQAISVVKIDSVKGDLKRSKTVAAQDGLHFELVSTNGHVLWAGRIADPRARRIEYEEPEGSGKIVQKTIETTEAEFVIRVPRHPASQKVEFYSHSSSAKTSDKATKGRTLIGSVALPAHLLQTP